MLNLLLQKKGQLDFSAQSRKIQIYPQSFLKIHHFWKFASAGRLLDQALSIPVCANIKWFLRKEGHAGLGIKMAYEKQKRRNSQSVWIVILDLYPKSVGGHFAQRW
jgi:hypothetical protein